MPKTFPITGKTPKSAKDVVYFEKDSDTLDRAEVAKVRALVTSVGSATNLTLVATASDDESNGESNGEDLCRRRVAAVVTALRGPSETLWTGKVLDPKKVKPQPRIDYRAARSVRIVREGKKSDESEPAHKRCRSSFEEARRHAVTSIEAALEQLSAQTLPDAVSALVHHLFGPTVDLVELRFRLATVKVQVAKLKEWKPRPGGQEEPPEAERARGPWYRLMMYGHSELASNSRTGDHAIVTFGPEAVDRKKEKLAFTFVHECTHGSPRIEGRDWAYLKDRMLPWLEPEKALANPDSYAELVRLLALLKSGEPLPADIGTYPKDDYPSAIKDDDLRNTKRALAFVERYLVHTEQNLNRTHRAVWKCVNERKELETRYSTRLTAVRKHMEHPESSPPTVADCVLLAGVFDRHLLLLKRLRGKAIAVSLAKTRKTTFQDPDGANKGQLLLGSTFLELKTPRGANPGTSKQVEHILDAIIAAETCIPDHARTAFRKLIVDFAKISKLTPTL